MSVSKTVRKQVTQRAKNRCEYCKLSQTGQEAIFTSTTSFQKWMAEKQSLKIWPLLAFRVRCAKELVNWHMTPTLGNSFAYSILASTNGRHAFVLRVCALLD